MIHDFAALGLATLQKAPASKQPVQKQRKNKKTANPVKTLRSKETMMLDKKDSEPIGVSVFQLWDYYNHTIAPGFSVWKASSPSSLSSLSSCPPQVKPFIQPYSEEDVGEEFALELENDEEISSRPLVPSTLECKVVATSEMGYAYVSPELAAEVLADADTKFYLALAVFFRLISTTPIICSEIQVQDVATCERLYQSTASQLVDIQQALRVKRQLICSIANFTKKTKKNLLRCLDVFQALIRDLKCVGRSRDCIPVLEIFLRNNRFRCHKIGRLFYSTLLIQYATCKLNEIELSVERQEAEHLRDELLLYFNSLTLIDLSNYFGVLIRICQLLEEDIMLLYNEFLEHYTAHTDSIKENSIFRNEAGVVFLLFASLIKRRIQTVEAAIELLPSLTSMLDHAKSLVEAGSIQQAQLLLFEVGAALSTENLTQAKLLLDETAEIMQKHNLPFHQAALQLKLFWAGYNLRKISNANLSSEEREQLAREAWDYTHQLFRLRSLMRVNIDERALVKLMNEATSVMGMIPNTQTPISNIQRIPDEKERKEIQECIRCDRNQDALDKTHMMFGIGHPDARPRFEPLLEDQGSTRRGRSPRLGPEAFVVAKTYYLAEDVALALIISHEDTVRRCFEHLAYIDWQQAKQMRREEKLTKQEYNDICVLVELEIVIIEFATYHAELDQLEPCLTLFSEDYRKKWKQDVESRQQLHAEDFMSNLQTLDLSPKQKAQLQQYISSREYSSAIAIIHEQVPSNLNFLIFPGKELSVSHFETNGSFAPTTYLDDSSDDRSTCGSAVSLAGW